MICAAIKPALTFVSIIAFVSIAHWCTLMAYSTYCIDHSIYGLLTHWAKGGSPACRFMDHTQHMLSDYMATVWQGAAVTCGAWVASNLIIRAPKRE